MWTVDRKHLLYFQSEARFSNFSGVTWMGRYLEVQQALPWDRRVFLHSGSFVGPESGKLNAWFASKLSLSRLVFFSVKIIVMIIIIDAYLKGLSKHKRMTFLLIEYLFLVLEILTFLWEKWRRQWRVSLELLKQCFLNLAPELYITKEAKWHLLCRCLDNSYVAGPVLIRTKIPRFNLKQESSTRKNLMERVKTVWEPCVFRARPSVSL